MSVDIVKGPLWTGVATGSSRGLDPLGLNRPISFHVRRLATGVTATSRHGGYFTLHALVAAETARSDLGQTGQDDLVRRCEVVLAAIAQRHRASHPNLQAHGSQAVARAVQSDGYLDVAALAAPGAYSQRRQGFWNDYFGAEVALGLIDWAGSVWVPGPTLHETAVRAGLDPLLELARTDKVEFETLDSHLDLCLCGLHNRADGEALARVVLGYEAAPRSSGWRRQQTVQMLLGLVELSGGIPDLEKQTELNSALMTTASIDPMLASLDVLPQWQGVLLRERFTQALGNLWKRLVTDVTDPTTPDALAQAFAEKFAAGMTLNQWLDEVSPPDPTALDTEARLRTLGLGDEQRWMATVLLRALLMDSLPESVRSAYESPLDLSKRLTPRWIQARVRDYAERPLRDFVIFLVEHIVDRAQRIATVRAKVDTRSWRFQFPEGVEFRDGVLVRTGDVPGSGVWFRWSALLRLAASLGWLEHGEGLWQVSDHGREVRL